MKYFNWLAIFACLLLGPGAYAQQIITVKGTITDQKGAPLQGVSVIVKNKEGKGTVTDAAGHYSIQTSPGEILQFSLVNYAAKELVTRKTTSVLNVSLEQSLSELDQVVVIGYGSVKTKDLTGSVSRVKAADVVKSTDVSLNSALQGRAAGVNVVSSEGAPGAKVSISIRAGSSISASNEPLYVINGFPTLGGSNLNLNVNDIESIDILKDASATAIYGSRGANGVVIITTKSGKAGKFTLSYDAYANSQSVIRKLGVLNAYQYAELQHYLATNPHVTGTGDTIFNNWQNLKDTPGINHQDRIFRQPISQAHNLSFSGGTENVRVAGSLGYMDQEGLAIATNYKRYTGTLNTVIRINKSISNETNIYLARGDRNGLNLNGQGGVTYSFIKAAPWLNGSRDYSKFLALMFGGGGGTYGVDPYTELTKNQIQASDFNGSLNTAFNFKLNSFLNLRIAGGVNSTTSSENDFYPSITTAGKYSNGSARSSGSSSLDWLNENTLSFDKTFNKHSISSVVGFTMQHYIASDYHFGSDNYPIQSLGFNNIGFGENLLSPRSSKLNSGLVSYLGRINYGYSDKYLFTFSIRADGSSKFPNNKWGYFPSGAFAWKVTEEPFMMNVPSISTLKLRLSYGATGNESIDPYSSDIQYSEYKPILNERLTLGLAPLHLGTFDLRWETTIQKNLGIDLGILKDRIFINADAYEKKSKNLLLNAPISTFSGFTQVQRNIGDIMVRGLELSLNTVNIRKTRFTWNTNFNISFVRGKVLALTEGQDFFTLGPLGTREPSYIVQVGKPLGEMYGYVNDGIINTQEELVSGPEYGSIVATVGSRKYKDVSGPDGKPDGYIDEYDKTVIGNGNPKFFGGFNNEFRVGSFDFSFLFTYSYGNDILNTQKGLLERPNPFQGGLSDMQYHWTNAHPQVNMMMWDYNYTNEYNSNSSYLVEDGSYLRLKNIMVGYTLPVSKLKKIPFQQFRLYASGQNLLTFTKYSGFDPEVSYFNSIITPGADLGAYPRGKIFTLGIHATF